MTKDNKSYIVCNLQKGAVNQVPLDLNFSEGEEVTFTIKGEGVVHLTGYLMPDEDPDFGDLEDLDAIYGLNKANRFVIHVVLFRHIKLVLHVNFMLQ